MNAQELHNLSEAYMEVYQKLDEAEVIAMKGGVPGSVKVRPALSIPGTSIGIGPNRPVPGTFTTTTPGQREKITKGDTAIDRGTYQQPRVGAGPTSDERQRYNRAVTTQGTGGKYMKQDYEYDVFDYILEYLISEGYAETPEQAQVIMVNMSEEWRESIMEMDDFAAGGGNAKMKKTGMSKDQVISLGKKNLANVAKSSENAPKASGSAPARPQTTKSDVDLYKLKRRDDRSGEYQGSSAMKGKIQKLKDMEDLESLEQRRNQRWAKNELQPGVSGTRSVAGVEADYMRSQGKSFGVNPKDTEKSINTIMQRRKKAAGM